jgi:hypothetical protein
MHALRAGLVLAVGLTACTQSPTGLQPISPKPSQAAPTTSAASTTTATKATDVLLVVVASTPKDQSGSVALYRTDGTQAAQFPLQQGSRVLAVAGSRIFVASGDQLKAMRRDGSLESLGSIGTGGRWFASNPDGTRWIWGTADQGSDPVHSAVHLAGDGLTARVIETAAESGRMLAPLTWTKRGAFVALAPVGGHGGYFPFGRTVGWLLVEGPVHRLDPTTGQVTSIPQSAACMFADEAADRSLVCFPGGSNVRLYSPGGKITNVSLAKPRFNITDEAFCAPSEAICTVAGATGVGNRMAFPDSNSLEQYGTDLIQTNGTISRFGPDGVDPAMGPRSWLPDGRLVLWRRTLAAGGASGVYVLDRSGKGPFIPTTGEPVGYLG